MAETGVALTRAGYEKLKRVVQQLEQSHKNLSRRLRSFEKKRKASSMAIRLLLGKTNATHNKGNSGVVNIWHGHNMGTEVSTGKTITAKNRFGNIGSGKWVIVAVFRGNAYIIAAECP